MRFFRLFIYKFTKQVIQKWHKKQIPSCGGDCLSPAVHRYPNLNLMKKTLVRLMRSKHTTIYYNY
jgi:hypothetical protein